MAGLQIIIPGADFSDSGIPRNTRYIRGTELPAAGALGLFLLEEGTPGSVWSGAFENLVPGTAPGRVFPGWAAPRMRNFGSARGGFEVPNINGTLIDTRIPAQRSQFTMAMVVRTHARRSSVSPYNLIHMTTSDTANNLPASNEGNLNLINSGSIWGMGAALSNPPGPFIRFGPPISNSGSFTAMTNTLGVQDQWNAIAISVDGPAGSARFQSLTDFRTITDAERGNTLIQDAFVTNLSQRNGTFLFGGAVNGPNRDSEGPLVDVMCAAVYGIPHGAAGIETILRGLAQIAAGRGVAVAGY
ncbi:hypothetical protein [Paracoccus siganidrum]|uniref:Uncharacterized protein n=1 Tax=Paracoccus siganidrum TaxID=1276757 RepID=A0A419A674_9RHOB|nr:hypothetical protein [Paracoccus siganidrum]RJL13683.1 hypothetical protein D3P05_11790 [Paracoccus siganidrum]RMC33438.1 hypothetical protein C9E82_13390 [Paracoccus siganidrum]